MKNVWLIHNNIPPYRVPLFAEIAKHADFDFTVLLTAPKCRHRPHWKTKNEAMTFKILTMKGLSVALSDSASVSISLGLLPSLIRRRPDILICSGLGLSTLMVFIYCRLLNKKYIVWSEATKVTERLRRRGRLRRWIMRALASNADAFIDSGRLSREYIQSLLPASSQTPFFRSFNCVDGALFSSSDSGDGSEPGQLRRILFVGRLNQNKGIPMLLDVYSDVLEQTKRDVALVLVGDGPLRSYVEQYRQSKKEARVELCGQIAYTNVAQFYRECDMFVLLSLADCNPLVIFEALHAGIPIVCSENAGNAPDFIIPGHNGYIVNPEDRDSIVRCLSDVLNWDAAKRVECARVSREQVKKANYRDSSAAFIQACNAVFDN